MHITSSVLLLIIYLLSSFKKFIISWNDELIVWNSQTRFFLNLLQTKHFLLHHFWCVVLSLLTKITQSVNTTICKWAESTTDPINNSNNSSLFGLEYNMRKGFHMEIPHLKGLWWFSVAVCWCHRPDTECLIFHVPSGKTVASFFFLFLVVENIQEFN